MDVDRIQKVFPSYMEHINLPDCAKEQKISVYRACQTRKIERESFLNTFEENGFQITVGGKEDDPQEYCLSTYTRPKDLKRFVLHSDKYDPPWLLAKGCTAPSCGKSCRTRDWKHTKSRHVDWWLYENSSPWEHFQEADYETEEEKYIQDKRSRFND